METIFKPSVINQLKSISINFKELIAYEMDVSGNDMTDCILYSKIKDSIDNQIKEIESRSSSESFSNNDYLECICDKCNKLHLFNGKCKN